MLEYRFELRISAPLEVHILPLLEVPSAGGRRITRTLTVKVSEQQLWCVESQNLVNLWILALTSSPGDVGAASTSSHCGK